MFDRGEWKDINGPMTLTSTHIELHPVKESKLEHSLGPWAHIIAEVENTHDYCRV